MRAIASLICILILTVAVSAQQPVPSFEEVVARMTAVNASLETFRVEQEVVASLLFFRFVVSATVYAARPARYHIIVHDAPWFLHSLGSEFAMVARPEDVLVLYSPRTVAWREEDGRSWLYLALEEVREGVNPPRVEALIDPAQWLVGRTTFHYPWGDLVTEYNYRIVDGFYLPDVLQVRLPGYMLSATVRHHDYQLNIPIADEVFTAK
jgi:hypothetical protein